MFCNGLEFSVMFIVNVSPSFICSGPIFVVNSFSVIGVPEMLLGHPSFGVSLHPSQKLFIQDCVPLHPSPVMQFFVVPVEQFPQLWFVSGFSVVVPQSFSSVHVLVCVPFEHVPHSSQAQYSSQGIIHSVV